MRKRPEKHSGFRQTPIYEMGYQALKDAHLPTHQLTIDQANRIAEQIDWGAQATFGEGTQHPAWVDHNSSTYGEVIDDEPGVPPDSTNQGSTANNLLDHLPKREQSKPFSRSANLPSEDE